MTDARLLIVYPDPAAVATLESMLRPLGCEAVSATDDRAAARLLAARPGLLLLGVDPADPDALELLTYARRHHPGLPVVVLVSAPHAEVARRADQQGAEAVLVFPPPPVLLREAVTRALASHNRNGRAVEPPAEVLEGAGDEEGATGACTCACHRREAPIIRPLWEALEHSEREILAQALRVFGGCRVRTAEALGINRTTLYHKLKKYHLAAPPRNVPQRRRGEPAG